MTVSFFIWLFATLVAGILYASFFEWALHKYVMHRPVGKFRYAFQAHAVVHHQTFKADETYHLIHEKDRHTIPMAWWNGPVLVVSCSAPFWMTGLIFGNWGMVAGALLAGVAYYSTYEYLHWCMHLPKERQIERPWFFRRLNGHHLLHHRYMHKNFNVVLPFADFCLGTLISRSPICFKQAKGSSVPSVQPLITNIEQAQISPSDKRKAS